MRQHEIAHAGGLRELRELAVPHGERGEDLGRRRAAQVVAHVDQDVAVLRQRLQRAAGTRVAGIDERLPVRVEPVSIGNEVRREMMDLDGADGPAVALHDFAGRKLVNHRLRPGASALSAARAVDIEARLVLRARNEVESEHAVIGDETPGDRLHAGRAIHLELGHPPRTLVPARKQETRIVADVVVVMVAEERVRHLGGREAELQQSMVRAEPVIEHEVVGADLQQVAGAHPPRRRRGRAGAEEPESHRVPVALLRLDRELGQEIAVLLALRRHELLELRGGHVSRLDADVEEAGLDVGRVDDLAQLAMEQRHDIVRACPWEGRSRTTPSGPGAGARRSPVSGTLGSDETGRVPAIPSATSLPALTWPMEGGMPEK